MRKPFFFLFIIRFIILVVLAAVLLTVVQTPAKAQSMPDVPSVEFYPPSSSSLITNIEYPVSPMTGIPDISIPLYTVKSASLELPIVLKFHSADFFRGNTYSGPLGAGWSLSCEMEVTHSIRGLSDIVGGSTPQQRIVPSENAYGAFSLTAMQKRRLATGLGDGEPDLFYYSTVSGSGRFFLGNDGTSVTMLESNGDKVQFASGGESAFTVTDSYGRRHRYAGTTGCMDTSGGTVYSWKLKSVRDYQNTDSLTFSYYNETVPMPILRETVDLYDSLMNYSGLNHVQMRIPRLDYGNGNVRYLKKQYSTPTYYNLIWDNTTPIQEVYYSNPRSNHYISRINFRGGYVVFQYQTRYPTYQFSAPVTLLSRMDVYADGNPVPVKTITFEYPSSIWDHCCATLSGITINGTEKYSFKYSDYYRRMGGSDYWGNESGYPTDPSVLNSQVSLTPGKMFNITNGVWSDESRVYTDNQGHWQGISNPNEKKFIITYPSGGSTEFTFEYDCYDDNGTPVLISSRRVSMIRHFDRDSSLFKTIRYEYGENGTGAGHIIHKPTLTAQSSPGSQGRISAMTEQKVIFYKRTGGGAGSGTYSQQGTARKRSYLQGTVFNDCFRGSGYVLYPTVTEYQDSAGTIAGKTVYRYDLGLGFINDMSEKDFPYTIQQEYWQCGRPRSTANYRYTDNGWRMVDSTSFVFGQYYGSSDIKVARGWQKTVAVEVDGDITPDEAYDRSEYEFRAAKIQVGCNRLLRTVHTEVSDDGKSIVTTEQKGYVDNKHPHLPQTNTVTYPDGKIDVFTTLYTEDLSSPLAYKNVTGIPMQQTVESDGTLTKGNKWYTDSVLNPAYFYRLEGGQYYLVASVSWTYKGRIMTISNRGMPMRYYVWDSAGKYPLAEMVGSMTTSATYIPLVGMSSMTTPFGLTTEYEYDGRGRLNRVSLARGNDTRLMEEYSSSFDSLATASGRPWTRTNKWRTAASVTSGITWCNGFGLPAQECAIGASPSGKDIIHPIVYDSLLRADSKVMLPYEAGSSGGSFHADALAEQSAYYIAKYGALQGARAWYENEYDRSPGARVIKERLPGSDSFSQTRFLSNGENEVRMISFDEDNWPTRGEGSLNTLSWYPSASLYCLEEKSKDGDVVKTYTDGRGRTILVRQNHRSGDPYLYLDTYYVYDKMGRLRLVLPPKASESLAANALLFSFDSDFCKKNCYVYWYDGRGNVTKKRIPQCDSVEYEYDNGDRIVKVTDGNLRNKGQHISLSYDSYGRQLSTSLVSISGSELLVQKAYDTYPASVPAALAYDQSHMAGLPPALSTVTEYPTYEKIAVLYHTGDTTGTEHIERVYYYDQWGNVIQAVASTHKGGVLRTSRSYDYLGNALHEVTTHKASSGATDSLDVVYTYDHAGRLTGTLSTLNGVQSSSTSMVYDGIGNLIGADSGTGTVLSQRITDDIRGRRTGISATIPGTTIYSDSLAYSAEGRVATWKWQQNNQPDFLCDTSYDGYGRLLTSMLYSPSGGASSVYSSYGYDSNTNLTSSAGVSFPTDGNQRTAYTYDSNGNATYDSGSSIGISYNILNLPDEITHSGSSSNALFVYAADGSKLEMIPDTTDIRYMGPFIYSGDTLRRAFFPGGSFEKSGSSFAHRYVVADHLGSTRAVVDGSGTIVQQNDYDVWGASLNEASLISGNYPYLYGGKESLALFDIPYYNSIARLQTTNGVFLNADPLAELSYPTGPYAYCPGNPLSLIDPFGLTTFIVDGVYYEINDGYNDKLEITAGEFWTMTSSYGSKYYDFFRELYMDWYGYISGNGDYVLAASYCNGYEQKLIPGTPHHEESVFKYDNQWAFGTGLTMFSYISSRASDTFYNPSRNQWIDKRFQIRSFDVTGNQYIGGRNKWGKTVSKSLKLLSKWVGITEVGLNAYRLWSAETNHDKWIYGIDTAVSLVSLYVPYAGIAYGILVQPVVYDAITNYYNTKEHEATVK